jgi:membrane protein DedA with SNARE-associated domain
VIGLQLRAARWLLLVLAVMSALTAMVFGLRSYRSFVLLRSAIAIGAPDVSGVRPWMTLRYIADTHHVQATTLVGQLELPAETDLDADLGSLAEREAQPRIQYVQRVQLAIVQSQRRLPSAPPADDRDNYRTGWVDAVADEFLAALLAYGYPILALTLLLGAIGLPVPTGLSAAVAGSLAARGSMSVAWAGTIAVAASVLGDTIGYGLGRMLTRQFLERHGRWVGYTATRRAHVESVFRRWGASSVLLSRTLASHLSAVLNLLAGATRYQLPAFLVFTAIGRVMWTSAYLGLGYAVGANLEAGAGFLTNLSILLVSLSVLVTSALVAVASESLRR